MTLYAPNNGFAKKATKLYAPVNGVAKEVTKLYGSENGVARVVFQKNSGSDYVEVVFDASGTATIANKWTTPILYSVNGGSEISLSSSSTANITVSSGSSLIIREGTPDSTFRAWRSSSTPFVKTVSCHISKMPSMDKFTTDTAGTTAGKNFFLGFNQNGSIKSLPAGSFDTSNITTVGTFFFKSFNQNGSITSLPAGSFDTSNITTVGNYFFENFNSNGNLTSLPAGSFDTTHIRTVGSNFFSSFNGNGTSSIGGITKNTSKPTNTFNITTSAITAFYKTSSGSTSATIAPGANFNWNMR